MLSVTHVTLAFPESSRYWSSQEMVSPVSGSIVAPGSRVSSPFFTSPLEMTGIMQSWGTQTLQNILINPMAMLM